MGIDRSYYGRGPIGNTDYVSKQHPKLREVPVMLEFGEEFLIYDIPVIVGPGLYANLGDANGGSAILLAMGLRDRGLRGEVWTVDKYPNWDDRPDPHFHQKKARLNYEKFKVADLIQQFVGTTEKWGRRFTEDEDRFKFVFVDADHSYESVKMDIELYAPLVEVGGTIGFHDTNAGTVDQAITEAIEGHPNWELTHWVNRIKLFKRVA